MVDKAFHITNGDVFTERLKKLGNSEDIVTWREILCEGPTLSTVFSSEFIKMRSSFLADPSSITTPDYKEFVDQFNVLSEKDYDRIILWFEYDLFCHINLAAVVSFLSENYYDIPLFLVCSGKEDTSENLYGLNELSDQSIRELYKKRTQLFKEDIECLVDFWNIYSGDDHRPLASIKFNTESFPYMSSCIKAHYQRFPSEKNELNHLEEKVLKSIHDNVFHSEKELLGYLLRNQEYYGFGDLQWFQIMERMKPFYSLTEKLALTKDGSDFLSLKIKLPETNKQVTLFGGSLKYDYFYNPVSNQLIKA